MTTSRGRYPAALDELPLGDVWKQAGPIGDTLNPFLFTDRIALYKQLIEVSNSNNRFGADNTANPLWGLIFQLHWQYNTNRLGLDEAPDSIDANSPWGYGNFTLSVIPYLGAINAGLVSDLNVVGPAREGQFAFIFGPNSAQRTIPDELRSALEAWKDFFALIMTDNGQSDQEYLRKSMWHAHKQSLDVVAQRLSTLQYTQYSELEMRFLKGWCRMVDFLWAAAWVTDFTSTTENGLDVLPHRPLEQQDLSTGFADFSEEAARNTQSVLKLQAMSDTKFDLNLGMWRRAMRTSRARANVNELLSSAVADDAPLMARMRLLWLVLKPS